MGKIIKITETQLKNLIDRQINEQSDTTRDDGTYMILSNLVMMKDYIDTILKFKHKPNFNTLITGKHAWAADHIATSKDDIQEVSNFIESYYEKEGISEGKKMKGEDPCWDGFEMIGKKILKGKEVPNCVRKKKVNEEDEFDYGSVEETNFIADDSLNEAEYKGRKVKLGKPFLTPDGPKKRSVYVKNAKGNVVKVNFGDPNMRIKKNIPSHRKSFRARHHCETPGPRDRPRYWSCKFW